MATSKTYDEQWTTQLQQPLAARHSSVGFSRPLEVGSESLNNGVLEQNKIRINDSIFQSPGVVLR